MFIAEFAKRLPYKIKQPLKYIYGVVPPSIHYGRTFRDTYKFLQESQWWSREKLEEYQTQQLSKLLHHAYENVLYYRKVFDQRGLKPRDIQNFNDLRKLPYLSKEIIRHKFDELIAKNIPKSRLELVKTSGSTMSPLSFYCEEGKTGSLEAAFIWTMWTNVGWRFKDKKVHIGSSLVRKSGSWWQYDPIERSLILSPYHMTEENLHNYVKKMEKFKPKIIKAIPSSIIVLADFMFRNNIGPIPSVKIILLGSEMLYPWQRARLEQVFNCRVFSHYGQNEKVVLAGGCEKSDEYHIFAQYGVTEIIGQNGEQVKKDGERGEIVGTGFNNYAMPFIRYKTGDIATWINKRCVCGREYTLLGGVEGRQQEFIVSRDGHLIPIMALPYSSILRNVKQFQFYQDKPGEVILKVVQMPAYRESDSEHILKGFGEELTDVKLHIRFVDHIPRTGGGKYLYVVQDIPVKFMI